MITSIFLSGILLFSQSATIPKETLSKVLPANGEVRGWIKHRPMQHFAGDALYEYINGGAEIYREYGFVRVVVQDYINDEGKSVSVELFQMASPESAYGMYTSKTGLEGKKVSVGNGGQLADYYMNFWKGSMLVTLTGFDETQETRTALGDIAECIDSKIPAGGDKPRIVAFLPEENLLAQSIKYFRGFLGLRNSHPFFNLTVAGFAEGVKGDYAGDFSLFLFRFEEQQAARSTLKSVQGQKDRRGRNKFLDIHGPYLMLVLGYVDFHRADEIFDRMKKRISG